MKTPLPVNMRASALQLGDLVRLSDGPFCDAVVKQIKDGEVTFFRPYGTSENFSYTGGVICYVGIEEFSRPITDGATFLVLQRKEVK